MTYRDAITLIDNSWLRNLTTPVKWADLGCGSGVFTLALADLLPPGSTIEAIDLNPTIAAQTTTRGVQIIPRTADFTLLELNGFDGILMANALHYVRDRQVFLERLKNIPVLLVEYDTDKPVPNWVPYPLSYTSASRLFLSNGWTSFEKLATRPSSFGGSNLYSAIVLPPGVHKDPSTISPSAYALLLMKGQTNIPYAREAAALMQQYAPADIPTFSTNPAEYWMRVMHFEWRYWSIDQLLGDLAATNILELSSGFSFRGLALSREKPVYYIDTDLPNIIATKQKFIDAFGGTGSAAGTAADRAPATDQAAAAGSGTAADRAPATDQAAAAGSGTAAGHYELLPLNALDPIAFEAVVNRFPPGPLTIVNEGLLVYLDPEEKERLCHNILTALRSRGGHWITADIYIQRTPEDVLKQRNGSWQRWEQEHRIEEKKFHSFHDAEGFFHRMGFKIDKEAKPDYARLTSLPALVAAAGPQALEDLRRPGRNRLHATWRLTPRR